MQEMVKLNLVKMVNKLTDTFIKVSQTFKHGTAINMLHHKNHNIIRQVIMFGVLIFPVPMKATPRLTRTASLPSTCQTL